MIISDPLIPCGERTKLLDFGIAKLAVSHTGQAGQTQTGMMLGTPSYMSPEQCAGASRVDARSDVYALGCVMYHMLAGRPPFVAEGAGAIIGMQQFVTPEPLARLAPAAPLELVTLIHQMLSKSRDDRLSMRDVAARLDGVCRQFRIPEPAEEQVKVQTPATNVQTAVCSTDIAANDTNGRSSASTIGGSASESAKQIPLRSHARWSLVIAAVGLIATLGGTTAILTSKNRSRQRTVPDAEQLHRQRRTMETGSAPAQAVTTPTQPKESLVPSARLQNPPNPRPGEPSNPTDSQTSKTSAGPAPSRSAATPPEKAENERGNIQDKSRDPLSADRQRGRVVASQSSVRTAIRMPGAEIPSSHTTTSNVPQSDLQPQFAGEPESPFANDSGMRAAENYLKGQNWREALRGAMRSENLRSFPERAHRVIGIAACNLRDISRAQQSYSLLLGAAQAEVASACAVGSIWLADDHIRMAEQHLAAKEWRSALDTVLSRGISSVRSPRAWRVIGIASCHVLDSRWASESLRHLGGTEWREVHLECASVGVPIVGPTVVPSPAGKKALRLAWEYYRSNRLAFAMSAAQDAIAGAEMEGWTVLGLANCKIGQSIQASKAFDNATLEGRRQIEAECRNNGIHFAK